MIFWSDLKLTAQKNFNRPLKSNLNAQGQCLDNLTGHTKGIYSLALLSNDLVASGAGDSTIKIWNVTTSNADALYTLTGHTNVVYALVTTNNNFMFSGSGDFSIILWDMNTYAIVNLWKAGTSSVLGLAFDYSLNVLASCDNANQVKLWDSNLWKFTRATIYLTNLSSYTRKSDGKTLIKIKLLKIFPSPALFLLW